MTDVVLRRGGSPMTLAAAGTWVVFAVFAVVVLSYRIAGTAIECHEQCADSDQRVESFTLYGCKCRE